MDVKTAIEETKAGKVEYRVDKTGVIHSPVGKVSFGEVQLQENAKVLINAVIKAKPTTAKGRYLKKINLAATMSPGVLLDELAYELAPERIEPRRPLGAMGLNSLMAMELRNRLESDLGRPLSATLAWNYPTVDALVAQAQRESASLRAAQSRRSD